MLLVYTVDNTTRLVLPTSQWAHNVIEKLGQMGHSVRLTDQDPDLLVRDEEELLRRDTLLESTGM